MIEDPGPEIPLRGEEMPLALTTADRKWLRSWLKTRKLMCVECEEAKPWEEMHRGWISFFASGVINAMGECKECREAGEAMNG